MYNTLLGGGGGEEKSQGGVSMYVYNVRYKVDPDLDYVHTSFFLLFFFFFWGGWVGGGGGGMGSPGYTTATGVHVVLLSEWYFAHSKDNWGSTTTQLTWSPAV